MSEKLCKRSHEPETKEARRARLDARREQQRREVRRPTRHRGTNHWNAPIVVLPVLIWSVAKYGVYRNPTR